jgi:hypothetical protein
MSPWDIVTIVLSSAGGSALVVGLSSWLGRVWADWILEGQRAANAKELEWLKSQLETLRTQQRRNSDALFDAYQDLWSRLADLNSAGDKLWEHASREHLRLFVVALSKARVAANRGRLILPEEQYQRLQSTFRAFEDFQLGKLRLIELRSDAAYDQRAGRLRPARVDGLRVDRLKATDRYCWYQSLPNSVCLPNPWTKVLHAERARLASRSRRCSVCRESVSTDRRPREADRRAFLF